MLHTVAAAQLGWVYIDKSAQSSCSCQRVDDSCGGPNRRCPLVNMRCSGFAIRGDDKDSKIAEAKVDATQQIVDWMNVYLKA